MYNIYTCIYIVYTYVYNRYIIRAVPKQRTEIIRYVIRRHFTTVPLLPLRNTTVSDNYSVRLTIEM